MFVVIKNTICLYFLIAMFNSAYAVHCEVRTSVFSFLPYDTLATSPTDTSGQIIVQCDAGQPYQIKLNAGLYAFGNFNVREMRSSQTQTSLNYNLFLDPSYSQVWGDGQSASLFYRGIGSRVPNTIPIFGRILPLQQVAPGQYNDSIVVTVEW